MTTKLPRHAHCRSRKVKGEKYQKVVPTGIKSGYNYSELICRLELNINILFYSFRLQLAISWKKKKTMKTFSYTTHSELMRKKMVTKYSHIIPRPKTIRNVEKENERINVRENDECREWDTLICMIYWRFVFLFNITPARKCR